MRVVQVVRLFFISTDTKTFNYVVTASDGAFQRCTRRKRVFTFQQGWFREDDYIFSVVVCFAQGRVANKLFVVMPVNAYTKKVWQKEVRKHMSGVTFTTWDDISLHHPQLPNLPYDVILFCKYTAVKFKDYKMYQPINLCFYVPLLAR